MDCPTTSSTNAIYSINSCTISPTLVSTNGQAIDEVIILFVIKNGKSLKHSVHISVTYMAVTGAPDESSEADGWMPAQWWLSGKFHEKLN